MKNIWSISALEFILIFFVEHNIKYIKVMQLDYIMNNKCLMHMLLSEKKGGNYISQQVNCITIC